MAFSQRDLYQVRREIEKDSKMKCAIIYGGLPPGEKTLVCIRVLFKRAPSRFAQFLFRALALRRIVSSAAVISHVVRHATLLPVA